MTRCAVVPYEGSEDYLFISYSHKDTKTAVQIMEQLRNEGYRIWYDEGIDPGSEWPENIASHLSGASACIGLISNNYLASDNCRRELNFALKRQIPYLSVMLEKVDMSAGVEMQLSANQAIFKYLLPSDDSFIQKINSTGILRSARALPAETEAQPEQKVEPEQKPEPEKKVKPEKPPKIKAEKPNNGNKKGLRPALIIAAALIVIAGIVTGILLSKSRGGNTPTKPAQTVAAPATTEPRQTVRPETTEPAQTVDVPETTEPAQTVDVPETTEPAQTVDVPETTEPGSDDILYVPDAPVNKDSLVADHPYSGRVLWGKKIYTSSLAPLDPDTFVKKSRYTDYSTANGTLNLSAVPYAVEVRGDDHPEILRLYYLDKVGTQHILQGSFSLKAPDVLTVSPCEKVFEDAVPVAEELSYKITLSNGYIYLSHPENLGSGGYRTDSAILSGAAAGPAYQEIGGVDLHDQTVGKSCTVFFTDGGKTQNATVRNAYLNIAAFQLSWTKEQRLYNGIMADFDVSKNCTFYYINTYPYGFVLIDNKDVYFYQQPLPAEEE